MQKSKGETCVILIPVHVKLQDVQDFFFNSLQPITRAHIAARDPQSSWRNAIVQSLLLAGRFLNDQ